MSDSPTPKKTTTKRTAKPQSSKRPQGKGKKKKFDLKKAGWYALAFLSGALVAAGGQMLYDRTQSSRSSANIYKLDKAA